MDTTLWILIVGLVVVLITIIACGVSYRPRRAEPFGNKSLEFTRPPLERDLRAFYQTHKTQCALVTIRPDGSYTIQTEDCGDNVTYLNQLMHRVSRHVTKLPACTFVASFSDAAFDTDLPLFYNSLFSNGTPNGVLYPLWYYFAKDRIDEALSVCTPWPQRKPQAVWRGSSTGFAGEPFRRGRKASRRYVVDTGRKYPRILDAGFTQFVQRYADTLQRTYPSKNVIPPREQCMYKAIISVDGNGGTHGLYWVLASGSCPVVNSMYRQWFSKYFKPGIHYLPFSDDTHTHNLIEVLTRDVPKKGRIVSQAARKRAREVFSEPFVLDTFTDTIFAYAKVYTRANAQANGHSNKKGQI